MLLAPEGQGQGVQKLSLYRQWPSALSQWIFSLRPAAISTEDTLHPWQAGEVMLVLPLAGSQEQP